MMPIEEAIVDTLQRRGPCCLEDVVTSLPNFSWGEVFLAVDRLSRDGWVSLLDLGCSAYQITLRPQRAPLTSATNQQRAQSSLVL
jgi:hypothetical protein